MTFYEDIEDPSAAAQQLVSDIEDWPSYSTKRYEYGFKQLARVRADLDAIERSLVADAREQRHTWEQIGRWIGTTRQNANQRFATVAAGRDLDEDGDQPEVPVGEWPAEDGLATTLTTVVPFPGVETVTVTAQPDVVFPHPPVDPNAGGLTDARAWCKWCGNRVIPTPEGWAHHVPVGEESVEGIIDVPQCRGAEPTQP
jgi:hypothetical protein